MILPFKYLSLQSKIWIYQSNRKFSDIEISEIEINLEFFLQNWVAHGNNLKCSYLIKYNRFIVIAVDQEFQMATGCAIDKLVQFIQELEQKYNVALLDKMNVTFKNGEHLAHKSLSEFKNMIKDKAVNAQTIVYNNLVNTIEEFNQNWEVAAQDSWHSRLF